MADLTLQSYSIQDLVNEIYRRSSSIVIAVQYYEEGSGGPDEPTTYSVLEGNFVHTQGLVSLLKARADGLVNALLTEDD